MIVLIRNIFSPFLDSIVGARGGGKECWLPQEKIKKLASYTSRLISVVVVLATPVMVNE